MPARPHRLIVVAGTGTDVGKTWVAARIAESFAGTVVARKPVQSFDRRPTDAEVLAAATGERAGDICPPHRSYNVAMAPFMAAAHLGRPPFTLAELVAELHWPPGVDVGLVESAGGVRSPITADGADTVDLAGALGADGIVLVADAGLGTLNQVRLALDALAEFDVAVLLNRFDGEDPLHRGNLAWLVANVTAPIATKVQDLTL